MTHNREHQLNQTDFINIKNILVQHNLQQSKIKQSEFTNKLRCRVITPQANFKMLLFYILYTCGLPSAFLVPISVWSLKLLIDKMIRWWVNVPLNNNYIQYCYRRLQTILANIRIPVLIFQTRSRIERFKRENRND